jgi:hypothetical protein
VFTIENLDAVSVGKALKTTLERLNAFRQENSHCKTYGCLVCKHFQRREGYDQEWGRFGFFYFKCKRQPNKDMTYNCRNMYNILDIEPGYNPNFYNHAAKGKCPDFERGDNELVYMSEKEKEEYHI